MKPLAFLIDRFEHETGGTEQQLLRLTLGLAQQGEDLSIVSLRDASRLRTLVPSVPVIEIGVGSLRSAAAVTRAVRAGVRLAGKGVGVAHCWFNDSSMLWPPILRALGVRTVVSRRDLGFWYTAGNLRWLRALRPAVDVVVANSHAVKDQVMLREGYKSDQVRIIPNGIWHRREIDLAAGMRSLPSGRWLVAVSNLRPVKRIDLAIRAVALLAPRYADLRLAVVGDDLGDEHGNPLEPQYRGLAQQLGIGDRVLFLGRQQSPERFVRDADICVLCSDSEGLSNALIEYALAMRPIACSDIASNREVVIDRESGLLFEPGSSEALASAIENLLAEPQYASRLASRAAGNARQQFSIEQMVKRHHDLYSELSRSRGRPGAPSDSGGGSLE